MSPTDETGDSSNVHQAGNAAGLPPAAIREGLDRILNSRLFRGAHSQQTFLRYAVEEALAGRGHQIKEFVIGVEAFGRGDSFDPRLDPIVRTQAAKLRARLTRYYETEGALDPLRIEFRKGSYLPTFRNVDMPTVPDAALSPAAPAETPAESAHIVSARRQFRLPRAAMYASALGAAALALALFAFRFGWQARDLPSDSSVAVMPFVSLDGGKDQDYFNDSLTGEIIAALGQVPGLRVAARTSVFRLNGEGLDIPRMASRLHVRTVLIGNIRQVRGRLRVNVQLNQPGGGDHLWSGSYERDTVDAASLPSEIAGAVASVLGLRDNRDSAVALVGRPAGSAQIAPSPSAYRNYLRGLYFWNKLNPEGLSLAIQYLEEAIGEDPSFARAYSALANCYVMAPQVSTAPPPEVISKMKAAASRALELDRTLGDAHFPLAVAAEYDFQWATAESEFQKGLQLSPGNPVGHLWYAKFLALVGRRAEVLTHRRIAAALDPVSPYAVQAVGGYFSVSGEYDAAIREFSNALALDPGFGLAHQGLGIAYLLKGMPDQAIAELQTAERLMSSPRRRALLAYAYGVSGKTAEARRILDDFLLQAGTQSIPALAIAQAYIGLGDKDRAFEWLQKAIDQRDLDVTLLWDSPYESLRSDPRFVTLLRRMKLAQG